MIGGELGATFSLEDSLWRKGRSTKERVVAKDIWGDPSKASGIDIGRTPKCQAIFTTWWIGILERGGGP